MNRRVGTWSVDLETHTYDNHFFNKVVKATVFKVDFPFKITAIIR